MARKAETGLRRRIVLAAKRRYPGIYIEHPHGSMYSAGMLDLVGCLNGSFFSLEVKMPGNTRVTDLQKEHIVRIRKAGGIAGVVRSVKEALYVLDQV